MIVKQPNTERLTGFTTGVTPSIGTHKRHRMTNPLAIYSEDIKVKRFEIEEIEGMKELSIDQWNSCFQQAIRTLCLMNSLFNMINFSSTASQTSIKINSVANFLQS